MARQIRSLIELTSKQTAEFLASLGDRSNDKARVKTIKDAMKAKYNVIL